MLKREKNYDQILYKQDDFVSQFKKQKSIKTTILESKYLDYIWKSKFDYVYFSYSGWRKVFFVVPEIWELAKSYDKMEIKFSKNQKDEKTKEEFFWFFDIFIKKFENTMKLLHSDIYNNANYWLNFHIWNFYANEAVKLVSLIVDSETVYWKHFCFSLTEKIVKHRKKIAFKAYEKIAKKIVKENAIKYKFFKKFFVSYSKLKKKLKASYDIKILKIFGSNVSKLYFDKHCLKIFEAMFS